MNGHVKYMRQAIELTRANRTRPFAALLVDHRTDQVVARGTNRSRENPTWHGEVDAINNLAASTAAPGWPDLVMYTTAEPCAMCQAAILWAGIRAVVYGSSIRTLQEMGWKQIDIRSQELARRTPFAQCEIIGGVLESECDQLFRDALDDRPSP